MLKYSLATHFISYYAKSFHCDLHLVGKESILDLAHSARHNTECIKLYCFLVYNSNNKSEQSNLQSAKLAFCTAYDKTTEMYCLMLLYSLE